MSGREIVWSACVVHLYVVYAGAHVYVPFKAIAAGERYSMMLKTDGTVWATGSKISGEQSTFLKILSGQ